MARTYMVGGAVRDELLGLPVKDRDWVVVGSTEEAMLSAGYTRVGKDFPVFLHPTSKEEYALARIERKTAPGYKGFAVHADEGVTLEEDLQRRDLTINAIARDEAGSIIDPYGGVEDLQRKVLRHVSEAFREDPVRVLRIARFSARYADFTIAPETLELMRGMVVAGEMDALVSERVWQEIAKGLMEQRPSRMFFVLRECGALARILPEVDALWGVDQVEAHHPEKDTFVHVTMVLDEAAKAGLPLPGRYACLMHDLGKGETPKDILPRHIGHEERSAVLAENVSKRLKVPMYLAELAHLVALEHGNVHQSLKLSGKAVMRLLTRCDAFRRTERFQEMLAACECDARGRLGLTDRPYPQRPRLQYCLAAGLETDTANVVSASLAKGLSGEAIGAKIHQLRTAAVTEALQRWDTAIG